MTEGLSEIITLKETARCVKTGKSSLCKRTKERKIPTVKLGLEKKKVELI